MDYQQGIQIDQLRGIARRRAPAIAAVAGAVVLLAIFVAAILPNEYKATATLLVEPQVISQKLVEAGVEQSDLGSRLHVMTMEIRSRSRLSRVIDELALYEQRSKEMTREQVIEHMNGKISVEPVLSEMETGRRTRGESEINTFRIHFRHGEPGKAAEVANTLANDFIEQHIEERVQTSSETTEFIESELGRVSTQLAQVESQIAEVKANNDGSLPENLDSNERLLERSVNDLRSAERELALARSDAAFYRQQAGTADRYSAGEEKVSPTRRLQSLELQLAELQSRGYTGKHPDVISTKEEIARLEKAIESGDVDPETGEETLSPMARSAQAEAERAQARAESAESEVERLREQVQQYEQRIARTPQVEEQLAVLQSRRASFLEAFNSLAERRQQATVAASMERSQKGQQFRLLESAYPPSAPASPNRLLIVLVGVVMGCGLGAGVGFLLEVADGSFHEARSLQSAFGVPVLGSVPPILMEWDRKRMRRRRFRRVFAAATLAGLVLVASVAGNWAVNGVPGPVATLVGGASQSESGSTGAGG